MNKPSLDQIIHAPNRLQICALLNPLENAEFKFLKDALGVSDSVLSKHLKQLEDAGYLKLKKQKKDGRQHTWASLTAKGRQAFKSHVAALKAIVAAADT